MAINWAKFSQLDNKQEKIYGIKQSITDGNYGTGPDQWTISEIIGEDSNASRVAQHIIAGDPIEGGRVVQGDLQRRNYRLKVVSRQACKYDKDGNYLQGFDRYDLDGPEFNEPAKEGDKIYVKGLPILKDPDDPKKGVTHREKAKMLNRLNMKLLQRGETYKGKPRRAKMEEATYEWSVKTVDKDGCIRVGIMDALDMLKTRGYGISFPERRKLQKAKLGEKAIPERIITNWYYLEVAEDYTAQEAKPKKRKPRAKKVVEQPVAPG